MGSFPKLAGCDSRARYREVRSPDGENARAPWVRLAAANSSSPAWARKRTPRG